VEVVLAAPGRFSAAGWTFANWSVGDLVTLTGTPGQDTITGSAARDAIRGGAESDTITGGMEADYLDGGDGDDVFVHQAAAEVRPYEQIHGGAGIDTIQLLALGTSNFQPTTISGVEKLQFAASAAYQVAAFSAAQFAGIGTIVGSGAANQVVINDAAAISLAGLTLTGWTAGKDNIAINGTAGNDTIVGSAGSDRLFGKGGVDSLAGHDGDDTFIYDQGADIAPGESIDGGQGFDTIQLGPESYIFGDDEGVYVTATGVENITFTNQSGTTSQISLRAEQVSMLTRLTGSGAAANRVQIYGATSLDLSGLGFVNWQGVFQGTSDDVISIKGGGGDDTLTGSAGNDIIFGGGGRDTLRGGGAPDDLFGSAGDDTIIYGASDSAWQDDVDGGSGTDTLRLESGQDFRAGTMTDIETIILVANGSYGRSASFNADQLSSVTSFRGSNNSDVIEIADTQTFELASIGLTAWSSDDRFQIQGTSLEDVITMTGSPSGDWIWTYDGMDTVRGGNGSDTIETGREADRVFGGGGGDSIYGGADGDHLEGEVGADHLFGSTGGDTLFGGTEDDYLNGENDDDHLYGGAGRDEIYGGAGADTITGEGDQDVMYGGGGADTFVLLDPADSGLSLETVDILAEFNAAEGDRIDLRGIDANTGQAGDQAFTFVGAGAYTGAGQIRFETAPDGHTYLAFSTDSEPTNEGAIRINGLVTPEASWFLL
jgi:Ca2+-binding RTX toxin-like protein